MQLKKITIQINKIKTIKQYYKLEIQTIRISNTVQWIQKKGNKKSLNKFIGK